MPVALPTRRPPLPSPGWFTIARAWVLVARIRLLDRRADALVDRGAGLSDDRLLRLMRRWLALHDALRRLLPGLPEPEHVWQVRAILARPDPPTTGSCAPCQPRLHPGRQMRRG